MIKLLKNKKDRVDITNATATATATPIFSRPIETPPMPEVKDLKLEVEEPTPEEWIWVEGYKGTNNKIQGHGKFQFELDKEYHAEGNIEACKNGFHFSLNLPDVNKYYPWHKKSRYFKVKALVRASDYKKYGTRECVGWWTSSELIDKLVAKTIILIEEITFTDEVFDFVATHVHNLSMDDWRGIQEQGMSDYSVEYLKNMLQVNYSDDFAKLVVDKMFRANRTPTEMLNKAKDIEVYANEGLSKDTLTWLIMRNL